MSDQAIASDGVVECLGWGEHHRPDLTVYEMAKAMGLYQPHYGHKCSLCAAVPKWGNAIFVQLDQGAVGYVVRAICDTCLPAEFVKHMRAQADLDALVEKNQHQYQHGEVCA